MTKVLVHIQPAGRGYAVSVPALPGINAQGDTEAVAVMVARKLIRDRLMAQPVDGANLPGRQEVIDLEGPVPR